MWGVRWGSMCLVCGAWLGRCSWWWRLHGRGRWLWRRFCGGEGCVSVLYSIWDCLRFGVEGFRTRCRFRRRNSVPFFCFLWFVIPIVWAWGWPLSQCLAGCSGWRWTCRGRFDSRKSRFCLTVSIWTWLAGRWGSLRLWRWYRTVRSLLALRNRRGWTCDGEIIEYTRKGSRRGWLSLQPPIGSEIGREAFMFPFVRFRIHFGIGQEVPQAPAVRIHSQPAFGLENSNLVIIIRCILSSVDAQLWGSTIGIDTSLGECENLSSSIISELLPVFGLFNFLPNPAVSSNHWVPTFDLLSFVPRA